MNRWAGYAVLGVLVAQLAAGQDGTTAAQPNNARGQMLYEANCEGCHKEQIHWRAAKSVRDWASLRAMVRHWETAARLRWRDEDIEAVSQYLNARYYRYASPS
jgi:mono/diheme cytochrome c family protein